MAYWKRNQISKLAATQLAAYLAAWLLPVNAFCVADLTRKLRRTCWRIQPASSPWRAMMLSCVRRRVDMALKRQVSLET